MSPLKHWLVEQPLDTHFRPGTCQEVDCATQASGWVTTCDVSTPLGEKQAWYLRKNSGRQFTEESLGEGLIAFTFPPGEECFRTHRVPLERVPFFRIDRGPVMRPDDWIEQNATVLDGLRRVVERG